MPYVNIKVTRDPITTGRKQALIRSVTDLLVKVLVKVPQLTHIVIDDIDTDNWGIGGKNATVYRTLQQ